MISLLLRDRKNFELRVRQNYEEANEDHLYVDRIAACTPWDRVGEVDRTV